MSLKIGHSVKEVNFVFVPGNRLDSLKAGHKV